MPAAVFSPKHSGQMNLSALLLTEARELIEADPVERGLQLRLIETAPPFVSKHRTPVWGQWRVLRARRLDDILELTVARELLGEEKKNLEITSPTPSND